jgi:tripartite-type tricarboxylate transporter receptor subunit TctC
VFLVGTAPYVVAANGERPYKNFADVIAACKASPGAVKYASVGIGTLGHLAMTMLGKKAGVEITHVPYRGGGPAIQDLVSGTIDIMFDVIPALLPHIREGRFRPLVAGSATRIDYVPELAHVPGMEEALPGSGIDALNWWSVVAPAGTPAPIIATLHGALTRVLAQPDLRERLLGLTILPMTDASPEAFGAFWRSQEGIWRELVEQSGARAE